MCDYDGTTYYVKDGSVDYNANMLYEYNGSTWNIKNGKVDTTESMTMNNGSLVYTNGGKQIMRQPFVSTMENGITFIMVK